MEQTKNLKKSNRKNSEQTVEVLYQKMGDRWFAFSEVNGEIFVGSISQDEIAANSNEYFYEPARTSAPLKEC